MEVEQAKIPDGGGGGGDNVTVTCTSFQVNEQIIGTEDDDDFELPETAYRSRHVELLHALGADTSQDGDFGDIQFFHHRGTQLHQQFQFTPQHQQAYMKAGNEDDDDDVDFDVIDVSNLSSMNNGVNNKGTSSTTNSSENPFVFPDNVMEYGEPQFFPGNCVGYLETILEETDEEYEEEEGCSGRHWWTADSDTDTDSVIRVDNNGKGVVPAATAATVFTNPFAFKVETAAAANNIPPLQAHHPTFRTSASSKPFELEDLQLLNQLDLAFEQSFLPARSTTMTTATTPTKNENDIFPFNNNKDIPTVITNSKQVPQFADDVQPAEVNEEDFFYSSSEEDEEEEEEGEEDSEEGTSSDDGKNEGIVLAEFSLNSSFTSATANRYRRSFEGSSFSSNSKQLRSFRSFDSLNCLAGTELLFSNPDTFPSFEYIKEEAARIEGEKKKGDGGVGCRDRKNSDSSGEQIVGVERATMSSENLSEDSGIGGDGSALNLNAQVPLSSLASGTSTGPNSLIANEFALNPFVYSEAEESMSLKASSGFNQASCADEHQQGDMKTSALRNTPEDFPSAATKSPDLSTPNDLNPSSVNGFAPSEDSSLSDAANGPASWPDQATIWAEELEKTETEAFLSPVKPDIIAQCNNIASQPWDSDDALPKEEGVIKFPDFPPPNSEVLLKFTNEDDDGNGNGDDEIINSSESQTEEEEVAAAAVVDGAKRIGDEVTNDVAVNVNDARGTESGPMPSTSTGLCIEAADACVGGLSFSSNNSTSSSAAVVGSSASSHPIQDPWLESVCVEKWSEEDCASAVPPQQINSITCEGFSLQIVDEISARIVDPSDELSEPAVGQIAGEAAVGQIAGEVGHIAVDPASSSYAEQISPSEANVPESVSLEKRMELAQQSSTGPIKTKTYGPRNEVEVVLISSRTPSPIIKMDHELTSTSPCPPGEGKKKEVHFCPVVSEISWRESYIEGSENNSESSDNILDGPGASVDDDEDGEAEELQEDGQIVTVQEQLIAQPTTVLRQVTSSAENGHHYEDVRSPAECEEDEQQRQQQSTLLPDLLSQCEHVAPAPTHTHIAVNIETKPIAEPPQARPTQQIFPSIFAEKVDSKAKSKAKSSSIVKSSHKDSIPTKESEKTKPSKPGFFERLSKIRLSGSSSNKNKNSNKKAKVHPKEKEAEQGKILLGPSGDSSTTKIHYEPAEETGAETFENILEDIAGINKIKMRQRQQSLSPLPSTATNTTSSRSPPDTRRSVERKQFFNASEDQQQRLAKQRSASVGRTLPLDTKLSQFVEEASRERDQLSKSHPDLETIQGVVRDSISVTIEHQPNNTLPRNPSAEIMRGRARSPEKTEREWYKLLRNAAEKYHYSSPTINQGKTGIVETDLDTGASREMLDLDSELVEKVPTYSATTSSTAKTRSLTNLTSKPHLSLPPQQDQLLLTPGELSDSEERAKSLEFLLDENNQKLSVPPENKLQQESRQLSEHELRIQRSLQKLNVPEWYKKNAGGSTATTSTSILKPADAKLNKRSEFGSASGLAGGWTGLSTYKTASLTSLQNSRYTGTINRNFVRGRPVTMSVNRASRESLLSPSSTASQSPSAFERSSFTYGMPFTLTRFGHGRLSSTGSASVSPPSTPVNPIGPTYTKKPYLGWRSQERLNNANNANNGGLSSTAAGSGATLKLSLYRPPEERLAAEALRHRSRSADRPNLPKPPPRDEKTVLTSRSKLTPVSPPIILNPPNIHDSIREVTEQINQLVYKDQAENEPPRAKPRQRTRRPNIWIESSFVGTKPAAAAQATTH